MLRAQSIVADLEMMAMVVDWFKKNNYGHQENNLP